MNYLVDTDVIINSFRFIPQQIESFWKEFQSRFESGELVVIDAVADEITTNTNKEKDFIDSLKTSSLILNVMELPEHGIVLKKVVNDFHKCLKINNFLESADLHLIATAIRNNCAIISYENSKGNGTLSSKIPDMCDHYKIPHYNLNKYMEHSGLKV